MSLRALLRMPDDGTEADWPACIMAVLVVEKQKRVEE
jgi:hypothetical protein